MNICNWRGGDSMVRNANRRRRQLVSRRLSMTPLTVAATLLGMSELALAGDGAVDAARPYPGDNGASQVLLKKMEAMEQRIKSLESQLKQKDAPPAAQKTPAAISDGKPRGKANRTLDLAAAPAGDLVADAPLPARRRHPPRRRRPARRRRPTRPTSPPNPPNPPRRRSRTPSRRPATKQSSA